MSSSHAMDTNIPKFDNCFIGQYAVNVQDNNVQIANFPRGITTQRKWTRPTIIFLATEGISTHEMSGIEMGMETLQIVDVRLLTNLKS